MRLIQTYVSDVRPALRFVHPVPLKGKSKKNIKYVLIYALSATTVWLPANLVRFTENNISGEESYENS
jgi:hypothetical protein